MIYFPLDLFYFYRTATEGPDFLKPESLVLKNPIIHKLYLTEEIINNINNSLLRLFLEDRILPNYYYLYANVSDVVLRNFKYKDNEGNILVIISPSQNGPLNPLALTGDDINNIITYLLNPNINDFDTINNIFDGEKRFCKLYWFFRIYKSGTQLNPDFYNEFKNTIRNTNSSNKIFIKLLEHIILKRIILEVFNKNVEVT